MRTAAIIALTLCSGCASLLGIDGTVEGDPSDGGPGEIDASNDPGFTIASRTLTAPTPLNGSNYIEIEVVRVGGFAGDVSLAVQAPPSGFTTTDIAVPAGEAIGELVISGAPPLAIGNSFDVTLVGSGSDVDDQMITIPIVITGAPGSLDTAKFDSGFVQQTIGGDDGVDITDATLAPNGDICATGFKVGGLGGLQPFLACYLPTGVIRPGWDSGQPGDAGKPTQFSLDSGNAGAPAYSVGLQLNGQPVSFGHSDGFDAGTPSDMFAVRLSATGAFDIFFGNGDVGELQIDLGADERLTDGIVLADDKLVVVGSRDSATAVSQLTAQGGGPDTTGFASPDGFIVRSILSGAETAKAVAVDSTGRLLVVIDGINGASNDVAILRLSSDGQDDATFATSGSAIVGDAVLNEEAADLALGPDGSIVVAGHVDSGNGDTDIALWRFSSDGALDSSFGTGGVASMALPGTDETAYTVVQQPDGRYVIAARSDGDSMLMRFRSDGAPDTTFDTDGSIVLNLGTGGEIAGAILHEENHLIVYGGADNGANTHFGVLASFWY